MVQWVQPLFGIWLLHLGVALTPGLNFALIGRTASRGTRREAMLVVAGIVTAAAIWVSVALFGLSFLIDRFGAVFEIIRLVAALYLVVLGLQRLRPRSGAASDSSSEVLSGSSHFVAGLATNLGNPKAIVFFSSLFATAFPADAPLSVLLVGVVLVLVNSSGAHGGLALILTSPRLRDRISLDARWLDWTFGALFVAFGLRLVFDR